MNTFFQSSYFAELLLEKIEIMHSQKLSLVCKKWKIGVDNYLLTLYKKINPNFIPEKLKFTKKTMLDKKQNTHIDIWLPVFDYLTFIRYEPSSKNTNRWLCYIFKYTNIEINIFLHDNHGFLYYNENYDFAINKKININQMPADYLIPYFVTKDSGFNIKVTIENNETYARFNLPEYIENQPEMNRDEFKTWITTLSLEYQKILNYFIY